MFLGSAEAPDRRQCFPVEAPRGPGSSARQAWSAALRTSMSLPNRFLCACLCASPWAPCGALSALSVGEQRPHGIGVMDLLGEGPAVVTPRRGCGRPGLGGFSEEVAQSWLQCWTDSQPPALCPDGRTWGPRPPPPRAAAAQLLPPPPHSGTSSGARGSAFHGPLWLPHRAPRPRDTQNPAAACVPVGSAASLAGTPAGRQEHGDVVDSACQPGRECPAFKEKLICN